VSGVEFRGYTSSFGIVRGLDDLVVGCMWGFLIRELARLMVLLCNFGSVVWLYCLRTCGIPVA